MDYIYMPCHNQDRLPFLMGQNVIRNKQKTTIIIEINLSCFKIFLFLKKLYT